MSNNKIPLKYVPQKSFFSQDFMDKFGPKFEYNYTIQKGDYLGKIAQQCGVTVQSICDINNIDADSKICAGKVLKIRVSHGTARQSKTSGTIFEHSNKVTATSNSASDEKILLKYDFEPVSDIKTTKPYAIYMRPAVYTTEKGETFSSIEQKLGLRNGELAATNPKINPKCVKEGMRIEIPEHVVLGNIKNLTDISKVTGVSVSFLNQLIAYESTENLDKNEKKKANTVGYGHQLFNDFEKNYYKKHTLSQSGAYRLLVRDLMLAKNAVKDMATCENFERLNTCQRDSLIDYAFNRGATTVRSSECKKVANALKSKNFKMAGAYLDLDLSDPSKVGGIAKRRLFEIAHYYNKNVPTDALKFAQRIYDLGFKYLDKNSIPGYNKYINQLYKGKIKLKN